MCHDGTSGPKGNPQNSSGLTVLPVTETCRTLATTEAAGTPVSELPEMAARSRTASDILLMVVLATSCWGWQVRLLVGLARNVEEKLTHWQVLWLPGRRPFEGQGPLQGCPGLRDRTARLPVGNRKLSLHSLLHPFQIPLSDSTVGALLSRHPITSSLTSVEVETPTRR